MSELLPRLKELFLLGKKYDIGINIDAEEANRLELSLDLMEALVSDPDLAGWQRYRFRCCSPPKTLPVRYRLPDRPGSPQQPKLMIRLVKGAYWDSEVKWAQVDGMDGYPTYTRKVHTDISYLACAQTLGCARCRVPIIGHTRHTPLGAIYQMGKGKELRTPIICTVWARTLYDQDGRPTQNLGRRVRVYAQVGTLPRNPACPYLVRRLLENGANSSS